MSVAASKPITMPLPLMTHCGSASSRMVLAPAPNPSAVSLLTQARQELHQATRELDESARFSRSQLAALRGAAAVLAARGRPHRGRAKPTSAWVLLTKLAPELAEWAAFFESCSDDAAAIRMGIPRHVSPRAADDLLRQACQFLDEAEQVVRHS